MCRDLVTGCGTKGKQLSMKHLTQTPLEEKPSDKLMSDGMKRVYFITLLNEEVVGLVVHHKLFHGLDHPPVTILGACLSPASVM